MSFSRCVGVIVVHSPSSKKHFPAFHFPVFGGSHQESAVVLLCASIVSNVTWQRNGEGEKTGETDSLPGSHCQKVLGSYLQ